MSSKNLQSRFLRLALMFVLLFASLPIAAAQEDTDEFPIQFSGPITSIDGTVLVVAGLTVDVVNAPIDVSTLQVGFTISIGGTLADGVVSAVTVIILDNTPAEPVATAEPTEEPTTPDATAEPTVPDATEEPTTPDATAEPNDDGTTTEVAFLEPIIVIEGPVVEINIDTIKIFDFVIQVDATDPILTDIQIGEVIRVEGQASFNGGIIIVIAINIIKVQVINVIVLPGGGLPGNCKISKKGGIKCSKKRS